MSNPNPKRYKMEGEVVVLPTCPKCGKPAVVPKLHACLRCDWKDPEFWNKKLDDHKP